MKLSKDFTVEYAHRLNGHKGRCKYLHGHSGKVQVVFEGRANSKTGMIRDFGDFDWLEKIIDELDHALVLQATDPLVNIVYAADESKALDGQRLVLLNGPPTAENICSYLSEKILQVTPSVESEDPWFALSSVSFDETAGNRITIEAHE